MDLAQHLLDLARFRFDMYKKLGDAALAQLEESDFHWRPHAESNSIAIQIRHLHGNMLSRWTDFLTTDGEKAGRDRDGEFESADDPSRETLMAQWEAGWKCLFDSLDGVAPEDLMTEVKIREQPLTVIDAILRQIAHVAYHVGQIVWIAKARRGNAWKTLSIPRGESKNVALTQKLERQFGGLR